MPWPCNVGPYREVRKNRAGGAHHIVPDMALRYGTRAEGMRGQNRIPNAPSFQGGIAICLSRPMHHGLHGALNVELRRLGNGNPPKWNRPNGYSYSGRCIFDSSNSWAVS